MATTKLEIEVSPALLDLIDKSFFMMQEGKEYNPENAWVKDKTDYLRYLLMKAAQRVLRGQKL